MFIAKKTAYKTAHKTIKKTVNKTASKAIVTSTVMALVSALLTTSAATAAPTSESATFEDTYKQSRPRRASRRPAVPNRPPPNRVQPGGGLDIVVHACQPESRPLTALVPVENPVYTASAHPTFLFYFPDDPASIDYAEFILLSADEKEEIYTTQFTPSAPGIVSVSLPADANKALEAGQSYHWYLNLHCQATTGVPSVNGWVQRATSDDQALQSADSPLPRLWYDQIAQTAAALTGSSSVMSAIESSDAQAQWNALLSAAGLDELVEIPIIGDVVVAPGSGGTGTVSVIETP